MILAVQHLCNTRTKLVKDFYSLLHFQGGIKECICSSLMLKCSLMEDIHFFVRHSIAWFELLHYPILSKGRRER